MNDDFEEVMDGLAAVALAVYLAMVLVRGNLKPFLAQVTKEGGFLEFLVAAFVIYEIAKVQSLRPFTLPMIGAVVIIATMRIVSGTNMAAFSQFSNGQIGLFKFLETVFNTQA